MRKRIAIGLAAAIGLSGCGGGGFLMALDGNLPGCNDPKNHKFYSGPPVPIEQVARIKRGNTQSRASARGGGHYHVQWIAQLNGAPTPGRVTKPWCANDSGELNVLPGRHRIVVMHDSEDGGGLFGPPALYSKTYHSLIVFDAKAGHRYAPHSRCQNVGTLKEKCEAWLVDEDSEKIVAHGTPVSIGDTPKRAPWREQEPKQEPKGQNQKTDGQGS